MVKSNDRPLKPRELALLRHVALYRLTLRDVVARHFPPDATPLSDGQAWNDRKSAAGTILNRLIKEGFLNHHHQQSADFPPLPGNVPYFTLSLQGAHEIGTSEERAEIPGKRVFGPAALGLHLAALWHATMYQQPRHRLEPAELFQLFEKHNSFVNVPHCIAREDHGYRINRIYVVSRRAAGIMSALRRKISQLTNIAAVRPWVTGRDFGIVVLAPDADYCQDIQNLIARAKLNEEIELSVGLGPAPETIRDALNKQNER